MQIKGWCLKGIWTKIMKHKYAYFCHLHGKTIFEMIIPFECSAVKDRRLWLMYSICSAPSDSNPDWCQLSGIILFAPHPFCAAISPSIPSYSTVTPNVTLIHPPIPPTTSLGFQIQCLLKLQSGSQSWILARTKGFPLFFEPHSHFLFHVFSFLYMQASDYNIFEGLECRGGPALVLSQGRVVYEEGNLQVQQGTGRFIPRKQFPDYVYQRVKCRNQVWNTHLLALQYSPLRFSAILSVYFVNLCIKIYIFFVFRTVFEADVLRNRVFPFSIKCPVKYVTDDTIMFPPSQEVLIQAMETLLSHSSWW